MSRIGRRRTGKKQEHPVEDSRAHARGNVNVIHLLAWDAMPLDGDLSAAARFMEPAIAAAPHDADNSFKCPHIIRSDNPLMLSGLATNPYFRPIHGDPRWQSLVEEIDDVLLEIQFNPELPTEIMGAVSP